MSIVFYPAPRKYLLRIGDIMRFIVLYRKVKMFFIIFMRQVRYANN